MTMSSLLRSMNVGLPFAALVLKPSHACGFNKLAIELGHVGANIGRRRLSPISLSSFDYMDLQKDVLGRLKEQLEQYVKLGDLDIPHEISYAPIDAPFDLYSRYGLIKTYMEELTSRTELDQIPQMMTDTRMDELLYFSPDKVAGTTVGTQYYSGGDTFDLRYLIEIPTEKLQAIIDNSGEHFLAEMEDPERVSIVIQNFINKPSPYESRTLEMEEFELLSSHLKFDSESAASEWFETLQNLHPEIPDDFETILSHPDELGPLIRAVKAPVQLPTELKEMPVEADALISDLEADVQKEISELKADILGDRSNAEQQLDNLWKEFCDGVGDEILFSVSGGVLFILLLLVIDCSLKNVSCNGDKQP